MSKQTKPARSTPKQTPRSRKKAIDIGRSGASIESHFPIIGIGASAGGLEALELFLKNVPEGSGMAFVIVQHQDPTHKGILVELLQRCTSMHVFQVEDRMRSRRLRVCHPDQQGYVYPARSVCTYSIRWRRAECTCRSISSSARWR